jgi:ribose 5-phosphate isomerase B
VFGRVPVKIAIGCDHAAYEMKAAISEFLKGKGHEVLNMGTDGPESVDYPDFAGKVSEAVLSGKAERGILICGTGLGMSMAANKYRGIRAALCSEPVSARLSREHNDSNVLCMGARMIGQVMAEEISSTWLETAFEGGRHQRRVEKIANLIGGKG